jgi:hypothetical protein
MYDGGKRKIRKIHCQKLTWLHEYNLVLLFPSMPPLNSSNNTLNTQGGIKNYNTSLIRVRCTVHTPGYNDKHTGVVRRMSRT